MSLETTKCNKDHALFEMRHLDTTSIVFELDLVSDTAHVMISKRCVQVYGS